MAIQWLGTTQSKTTSWENTHTVSLGSCTAEDTLLLSIGFDGSGGTVTPPDGWTPVWQYELWSNGTQKWHIYIRRCDGTEPSTVEFTTTKRNQSAALVSRYVGAHSSVVEDTGWSRSEGVRWGFGTRPNPDQVTAGWGSADNCYVAMAWGGGRSPSVTRYPNGYSNGRTVNSRVMVAAANKFASSSSEDPGAFTTSNSSNIRAVTIALRPAADVETGAEHVAVTAAAYDATAAPPTVRATPETATAVAAAHFAGVPDKQVPADLVVEWDLDNDGDFDESVEDITDYVYSGSVTRGRSFPSQLTGRSTPGRIELELDNSDGRFSQFNTASPLNAGAFRIGTGGLLRVRTAESTPTDPTELVRDRAIGNGPVSTTETGQTWTSFLGESFSEFGGYAEADGPPVPNASEGGTQDPGAWSWSPIDNHTSVTLALQPQTAGGTIGVRSSTDTATTGTATSHNADMPSSVNSGDVLAMFVSTQEPSAVGAPATPSGWTRRVNAEGHASAYRPEITVFTRTADGTEGGGTETLTWGSSVEMNSLVVAFTGVKTSDPFDVPYSGPTDGASNPDPTSITPATDGAWVVAVVAGNRPGGTTTPTISSGYTLIRSQAPDDRSIVVIRLAVEIGEAGTDHADYVTCGSASYYAQAVSGFIDANNEWGLIFKVGGANNWGRVYVKSGMLYIEQTKGGTTTTLASTEVEQRDKIALGLAVHTSNLIVYIDGVETLTATTTLSNTNQNVGRWARWYSQRPPSFAEFYVWDRARIVQSWDSVNQTGVRGTMRVTRVAPSVESSGRKTVRISATGDLADLNTEIEAPRSVGSGQVGAGHVIGGALHRIGLLHPPHSIAQGDVALGAVGFDRTSALDICRAAEATEIGFLYEAPDGGIRFDARSARDASAAVWTFTDDDLILGTKYTGIELLDWSGELINQVTSEVTGSIPTVSTTTRTKTKAVSSQNDVDISMPTEGQGAAQGDLAVVAFASTVQADGVSWETPPGWTALRQPRDELGRQAVFAKTLTHNELGQSVTFYTDSTPAGGAWVGTVFLVKNWFGAVDAGVAISEHSGVGSPNTTTEANNGDNNPPTLFTPWDAEPTLFIAMRAGMVSSGTGFSVSDATDDQAPDGYGSLGVITVDAGAGPEYDAAQQWAFRARTEQVQSPSPFGGDFTGFNYVEAVVVAVRGYAGDPPPQSGGFEVTDSNADSILQRRAVLTHPDPGTLYNSIDDAEAANDLWLTRYGDDRPILTLTMQATASERNRYQALQRDLSDRVRVVAANRAALGIDEDFYIETIIDTFGQGQQGVWHWDVAYDLSPATDPGTGADD